MSLSISDLLEIDQWVDEPVDSVDTEGSSMPTHPRVNNEVQLVASPPVIKPPASTPQATSSNVEPTKPTQQALFVKVHMEGVPVGRKLNILSHGDYDDLIATLSEMFDATIRRSNKDGRSDKYHVLTYEDKDGDWMMAGDVPWEMFITTVRRLRITRADKC